MGIFNSILSGIFGGPKKRKTVDEKGTADVDPYAPTIPYLNDYLANTAALYGGGAPQISPYEQQGYDLLKSTVDAGSPAIDAAIAANNKTLSGAYLDPKSNPYIADIAKRAAGDAGAISNSSFSGAGRTGSGLAGYYAGKGAADASGNIFYENYGDERNRMLEASGQAPSLEAGRYLGPQALISAGQNISSRPYDINSQYGNILSQIAGLGQQSTTTGKQTTTGYTGGLIGKIADSFTNKLFPT
jgi:hypothetical protein